jgi:hypothetical protein
MFSLRQVGFQLYTVHIGPRGAYTRTIILPSHLIAVSSINGSTQTTVRAVPGRYDLSLLLFDVHLPTKQEILAQVQVRSASRHGDQQGREARALVSWSRPTCSRRCPNAQPAHLQWPNRRE